MSCHVPSPAAGSHAGSASKRIEVLETRKIYCNQPDASAASALAALLLLLLLLLDTGGHNSSRAHRSARPAAVHDDA
jgi:hypothetical protein